MKYRIVSRLRREKKNLDGITPLLRDMGTSNTVEIHNWINWDNSLWVKITTYGDSVIIDSGVIEELAKEIVSIKRNRKILLPLIAK